MDFLVAFLLLLGVSRLSYPIGIIWMFLQLIMMVLFIISFLLCPFVGQNIFEEVYYTWAWIVGSYIIVFFYKIYRIRIIFFLLSELKEESRIWKQKHGSSYNYE